MCLEIRKARPGDAESISSVLLASFLELKPLYSEEGFAVTTPDKERVLLRMAEGPVWVAVLDGQTVGTASVVHRQEGLYIRGMAVLEKARGHQIGWRLLELIENYALENGFDRMFLSTTPFLDRAIKLYKHFGFRRIKRGPHDLHGTPLFSMEKIIIKK